MTWPQKTCPQRFRRCIEYHRLLEDGEAVVVGVSGGADSLCLLHLLHELNQREARGWTIHAVHVDPGFPAGTQAGWFGPARASVSPAGSCVRLFQVGTRSRFPEQNRVMSLVARTSAVSASSARVRAARPCSTPHPNSAAASLPLPTTWTT
ncbi:hypothetical protein FJY69_09325 [candidate division WOR-3 bacterium]|nr:hypothetical protein [candidate division WOR-3 bacterium]